MNRILILMRHGHYDFRDLSQLGEEQARSVATQVANDNLVPDLIVHSPMPRAVQTMQQVNQVFTSLGKTPQILEARWLRDDQFTQVKELGALPADKHVIMLVTHLPNVEDLTADMNDKKSPNHANAFAFAQQASSWGDFKTPQFRKAWTPA